MKILQVLFTGLLIFVGWLIASFVSGFINTLLLSFLPITGMVATIVSMLVFCLILGFVVVWLLAKFHSYRSLGPRWLDVRRMRMGAYMWH